MKLIVGLGNPGVKYAPTRHNIGRSLVERIAKEHSTRLSRKKPLRASLGKWSFNEQEGALAYPETYMNASGPVVKALVDALEVDSKTDLLVLVDDAALPFGHLRLRRQGTDGGHNGLKSIQEALGTTAYPRLRMGIGPQTLPALEAFVLEPFTREENEGIAAFLKRGEAAVRLWMMTPIEAAMNAVNSVQN